MACGGLHCAGCGGGSAAPAVALAAFLGVDWVVVHLVEVVIASAACGVLAVAAVVALTRRASRRDARHLEQYRARKAAAAPVAATVIPQVRWPDQPAIEHHHHGPVFNFYGPDGEAQAARVIRSVLPGQAGDAITTEEQ
jgi:hypothetical protein